MTSATKSPRREERWTEEREGKKKDTDRKKRLNSSFSLTAEVMRKNRKTKR